MKNFLIPFVLIFTLIGPSFADELPETDNMINKRKDYIFKNNLAIELEDGWNGYVGSGIRFDYRIFNHVSVNSGIGVGYWGFKFAGGLRYYWEYPLGLAFGIGATYNSGLGIGDDHAANEYNIDYYDQSDNKHQNYIAIDQYPVTIMNFTVLYGIKIASAPNGRGCFMLYVEAGYGYPLNKVKYDILVNNDNDSSNDIRMTDKQQKKWDIVYKPGGFIFSIGVSFLLF